MASKNEKSDDITIEPLNTTDESRKSSTDDGSLSDTIKKRNTAKSIAKFLYNPRKKTVLGRGSLNWAKLAAFYAVFYLFLGVFFVGLILFFVNILDRTKPRYYNAESTMAVRSLTAVVGMGFRPQPFTDSSLINITDDPMQQKHIATSLQLFRDAYLRQNPDARTEQCTEKNPASDLPDDVSCAFNWFHIVKTEDHPCSDRNAFGFEYEQPCILVKLNKVYGWKPTKGVLPPYIQQLRGIVTTKSTSNSDVYVTCAGTKDADMDVITNATYYSLGAPFGSSKYGVIPNYYFPYRNAKDHVQPFVLVQFNKLPLHRLVTVTCRAWAPGIEQSVKGMRGMVSFQLYRTHTNIQSNFGHEDH